VAVEELEGRLCLSLGPYVLVSSSATSSAMRYNEITGTPAPADQQSGATFVPPNAGGLDNPLAPLLTPAGDLLLPSGVDNRILRFDGNTGAYLGDLIAPGDGGLSYPTGMIFSPDHQSFFVASYGNSEVLRFDYDGLNATNPTVFATIPDAGAPVGLVFGPDNDMYVSTANPTGDTSSVLRFDPAGNPAPGPGQDGANFLAPGSGGLGNAGGIVFGPDGNLYVANQTTNEVLRFDGTSGDPLPATGQPGATFVPPGGGGLAGPAGLLFGPSATDPDRGRDLFVASVGNDSVLRYDGTTGASLGALVPSGSGGLSGAIGLVFGKTDPSYLRFNDPFVAVTSYATNSAMRYDGLTAAPAPAPGQPGATFVPPGSGDLASPLAVIYTPTGELIISSGENNSITRYNGLTGQFLGDFVDQGGGGLSFPAGMIFSPDHHSFFVASNFNSLILRYDYDGITATNPSVFAAIPDFGAPVGLVFGPDGNLYVSTLSPNADNSSVLRYDGTTGVPLPSSGETGANFVHPGAGGLGKAGGIVFGPDGNLYVSNQATNQILRFDGVTGQPLPAPGRTGAAFTDADSVNRPAGLLFGPSASGAPSLQDLYVIAVNTDNVLRFDGTSGNAIDAFIPAGSGGLMKPRGLAFDETDPTYLTYGIPAGGGGAFRARGGAAGGGMGSALASPAGRLTPAGLAAARAAAPAAPGVPLPGRAAGPVGVAGQAEPSSTPGWQEPNPRWLLSLAAGQPRDWSGVPHEGEARFEEILGPGDDPLAWALLRGD
jgi:sugar lactone lactonase YvrE